ncbi:hypothetical protein [Zoogloea sp.]|uniref:hypothetical protein n=1 Tax=Zoogloea sp. TaxID=49181 RepID=UPI001ACD8EB0|nr:hypothetical protein [Zoogloea sp.]MBN8283418.1 hypothetical protein [Zoogloea sp.]
MGQAKRRGNYEQRVASALERITAERHAARERHEAKRKQMTVVIDQRQQQHQEQRSKHHRMITVQMIGLMLGMNMK